MKKRLVTVGLAMMTAITLLIAGCGEEKNYIEMSYYDETSYEEGADYSTINKIFFTAMKERLMLPTLALCM